MTETAEELVQRITQKSDPVITLKEFKKKWGVSGPYLLIGEYIAKSQNPEEARKLVRALGILTADLSAIMMFDPKGD